MRQVWLGIAIMVGVLAVVNLIQVAPAFFETIHNYNLAMFRPSSFGRSHVWTSTVLSARLELP